MRLLPLLPLPALLLAGVATAQPSGAPYRASGTEPFWALTIDTRTMRLEEAGRRPTSVARPVMRPGFNGERYVARGMIVDVIRVRCTDGMSDRSYRDTVTVQVGRRTLRGCGGAEEHATLADTRWTVATLNGQAVRAERPLTVNFTADRVAGRLCNSFGGNYTQRSGQLTVGPVTATRMACAGPAMAVENALFALWRQPVRATIDRTGALVLSGTRDTVTLRRAR